MGVEKTSEKVRQEAGLFKPELLLIYSLLVV